MFCVNFREFVFCCCCLKSYITFKCMQLNDGVAQLVCILPDFFDVAFTDGRSLTFLTTVIAISVFQFLPDTQIF